jgi:hypothetical protein
MGIDLRHFEKVVYSLVCFSYPILVKAFDVVLGNPNI